MMYDELMQHYYMERLAFCALIKYRFKIDLQKDKISCANETLAFKYKPLPLNTAKKSRQKDNSSGLKINQVPARVFHQRTCIITLAEGSLLSLGC